MNLKACRLLLFLCIISSNAFSLDLNESFRREIQVAKDTAIEVTWSRVISNKPKRYLSLSFKTVATSPFKFR